MREQWACSPVGRDPSELKAAVREVLTHDGPALLDVITNRRAVDAAEGRTRAGNRFWPLSNEGGDECRGDEVIDLAGRICSVECAIHDGAGRKSNNLGFDTLGCLLDQNANG